MQNSPKIELLPDDYEEPKKVEEVKEEKGEEKKVEEENLSKVESLNIESEELTEEEKKVLIPSNCSLYTSTNSSFFSDSFETSSFYEGKGEPSFQSEGL